MVIRSMSVWMTLLIALSACSQVNTHTPPQPVGLGGQANTLFVVSTDVAKEGQIRFLNLATGEWRSDPIKINSDASARYLPELNQTWVVNRFLADNLQPIEEDFTRKRPERKVEALSDLRDIIEISKDRVLVSSQSADSIYEIDVADFSIKHTYSLRGIKIPKNEKEEADLVDGDGSAEPGNFWRHGTDIWVQLHRLNRNSPFWDPYDHGYIAILDTVNKRVASVKSLAFANPTGDFKTDPLGNLYVAQWGYVGKNSKLDGGIEKWNPINQQSLGIVITEKELGGDIVDFEILSETLGVAIVTQTTTQMIRFNPSSGKRFNEDPLCSSGEYAYPQVLFDRSRDILYLVDRTLTTPRIRLWNIESGKELPHFIEPGLPAFQIGFVP